MKGRFIGFGGAAVVAAGLAVGAVFGGMSGGAAETPLSPAPAAEAAKFKIDGVHSNVLFKIRHLGVSNFYGRFNKIKGEFTWDSSKPESSTINITIDTSSIDSNNEARNNHLKSPDFFNVKEHPEITFKSTSIAKSGDGWELTGDLTLLGKTKEVKAKFAFVGERDAGGQFGYRGGFDAMFNIKRSELGMNWGVENGALGDEVGIIVGIEGVRQ